MVIYCARAHAVLRGYLGPPTVTLTATPLRFPRFTVYRLPLNARCEYLTVRFDEERVGLERVHGQREALRPTRDSPVRLRRFQVPARLARPA